MYELKVIEEFSAAHRLSGYKGKCESLHGHNFQVELIVQAEDVGEHGMVVDFKSLKGLLKDCLDTLDHKYLMKSHLLIGKILPQSPLQIISTIL